MSNLPPSQVIILLHGLWFLEFDLNAGKLVVATPEHADHLFFTRPHTPPNAPWTLRPLDRDPLPLGVNPGPMNYFPDGMPTFPASAAGAQGQVLTSANAKYRCRMILPFPEKILPLRRGDARLFHADTSTSVGKRLKKGAEIATITCLVYEPGPAAASVQSLYAEHPMPPTCDEVNHAFKASKDLIGQGFDLQLERNTCSSQVACTERDDELPDGVIADDEFSLEELQGKRPCIHPLQSEQKPKRHGGDVSSCPQLGITP